MWLTSRLFLDWVNPSVASPCPFSFVADVSLLLVIKFDIIFSLFSVNPLYPINAKLFISFTKIITRLLNCPIYALELSPPLLRNPLNRHLWSHEKPPLLAITLQWIFCEVCRRAQGIPVDNGNHGGREYSSSLATQYQIAVSWLTFHASEFSVKRDFPGWSSYPQEF